MALCINQSGTYRNIITLCINQSGTYRNATTLCINQAGTYRKILPVPPGALGSSFGGGFVICKSSGLAFIVSPYSAEVSRTWYLRNDANTTAQSASGCTGWFVPTISQLQNPGYICGSFWGPSPCFSSSYYSSSTESNATRACGVHFAFGGVGDAGKAGTYCVRAFRCVTY